MMTQGKLSVVCRNEEAVGADGPKQILSSSSRRAKQHHASVLNLILVRGQNLLAYRLWRLRSLELRYVKLGELSCARVLSVLPRGEQHICLLRRPNAGLDSPSPDFWPSASAEPAADAPPAFEVLKLRP